MKLSDKSKSFLQKYQLGGSSDYEIQDPYNYLPSLEEARQQQIVQLNQPKNQVAYQSVPNTASIKNPLGFVPFIGPAINLGIGVKNIIDSFGEKKRQQSYQRAYEKDLQRRREESRTSDYYHTSYGEYQLGGKVNELNELDAFLKYYNRKERQNDSLQNQFEDYYNQKNETYKNQWKTKMNEGFGSALTGAVQLATMFQKGGKQERKKLVYDSQGKLKIITIPNPKPTPEGIPNNPHYGEPMRDTSAKSKSKDRFRGMQEGGEYDPTKDLYSPEYVVESPEIQTLNNEIIQIQQEDKQQSLFENWLFQDDYEENEINNSYFNSSNSQTNNVISQIGQQESGGNYQAKNPYSSATGKYQFTNQWAGQIKSFMGLPQSYNTDQVMEAFKNSPDSQESFMQYVVEDIYKPEVEKLRPLAQRYGLNDDKLIRMLHYRGLADTRKRLQSGDFSVSEEEKRKYRNPDILTYLNKE